MTTASRELFQLCKEVYERTGWNPKGKWFLLLNDHNDTLSYELEDDPIVADYIVDGNVPLYTSDYLLEKLPEWTELKKKTTISYTAKRDALVSYSFESDTPLKALLKLTLKLHEADELLDNEKIL